MHINFCKSNESSGVLSDTAVQPEPATSQRVTVSAVVGGLRLGEELKSIDLASRSVRPPDG